MCCHTCHDTKQGRNNEELHREEIRPLLHPRKTPVWDNGGRKSRICLLYKIFF